MVTEDRKDGLSGLRLRNIRFSSEIPATLGADSL